MKTYNNEEMAYEDADLTHNWPIYASADDRDDDLDNEENEEDDDDLDESDDWGDVDPAGGDAPSSPGSAV